MAGSLKIIVGVLLCINFANCITFYDLNFSKLKTAEKDSSAGTALLMKNQGNLGIYTLGSVKVERDKIRLIPYLQAEKVVQKNSSLLNYLSYFTFCLLPCVYESEMELNVDYVDFRINTKFVRTAFDPLGSEITEYIPGKAYKTEKISYSITQTGYIGSYFDGTEELSVRNYIQNDRHYAQKNKKDYSGNFNPLAKHLNASLKEAEQMQITERKAQEEKVVSELKSKKNEPCRKFYEIYDTIDDADLKKKIWSRFNECISKKVTVYANKKYPFLRDFLDKEIYFKDETTEYFLRELFFAKVVSYIPETGYKLSDEEFFFKSKGKNKFNLNFVTNGSKVTIEFENRENRLFCTSIHSGNEINPPGWQNMMTELFKKLYAFPQEDSHWDWDYIEKIK